MYGNRRLKRFIQVNMMGLTFVSAGGQGGGCVNCHGEGDGEGGV